MLIRTNNFHKVPLFLVWFVEVCISEYSLQNDMYIIQGVLVNKHFSLRYQFLSLATMNLNFFLPTAVQLSNLLCKSFCLPLAHFSSTFLSTITFLNTVLFHDMTTDFLLLPYQGFFIISCSLNINIARSFYSRYFDI